jgi:hypothetical protein
VPPVIASFYHGILLGKTSTWLVAKLAVAKSGLPSPSKSPTEVAFRAAEEQADARRVLIGLHQIEAAIPVEVGGLDCSQALCSFTSAAWL